MVPLHSPKAKKAALFIAPVHCAAGSEGETNFGMTSVAAPKAASSSVARYPFTAWLAVAGSLLAPFGTGDRAALVGVGLDEARIDGKVFAADEAGGAAGEHDALEDVAQHVAVAEAAVADPVERRVVGHLVVEVEAAEPAKRQPVGDLLGQPALRAHAIAIPDDEQRMSSSGSIDGRPV